MPSTSGTAVQSTGLLTWVINQSQGFLQHIITFLCNFRSSSRSVVNDSLQEVVELFSLYF